MSLLSRLSPAITDDEYRAAPCALCGVSAHIHVSSVAGHVYTIDDRPAWVQRNVQRGGPIIARKELTR